VTSKPPDTMRSTIQPALLVLAAGMGSRYGGLKQMEPVGPSGETIIDYSVYDALCAGFGKIVFVIRREIEQSFREIVGARFEKQAVVEYVFQELDRLPSGFHAPAGRTKPWGTTHAILCAADAIHEPFAVINADDFYGAEGYRLLAQHLTSGTSDYAMAGFILRNTLSDFGSVARGICRVSENGMLESVKELTHIERDETDGSAAKNTDAAGQVTRLTGDEIVSMNMWGFTPQVFAGLQDYFGKFLEEKSSDLKAECYLPSAVNTLVANGEARVKVLPSQDAWFGVTHRADHARVVAGIDRLIRSGAYPERLWR
jgi:UTP-glucose-1-phosphate uridylyltransferase